MKSNSFRRHGDGRGRLRPYAAFGFLIVVTVAGMIGAAAGPATAYQGTAAQGGARADVGGTWTDYDSQPLRVNIWHARGDDDVYRKGESVRISFEANRDAYAVVYRIDSEGVVTILWPRSRYDDGFIFGRHQYTLPAAGAPRLRAAQEEGVEYVEAIVSAYPFDLRGLEVDFHHEEADERFRYRVAGDPFLAMNEVNYAVTGLESPEDFVVTNYVSYYVEREVAHPRYLCGQCHAGDPVYHPYQDRCTVTINYDYGWVNRWYVRFGYYPAYYYPVYYYVDPWTWRPWVNYWYTPWYWWPSYGVYDWPYSCYVWNYSPYWQGDVWVRWRSGDRRYVPLDKRLLQRAEQRERYYDRSNRLVREGRPTREMKDAMERRTALSREDRENSARGGSAHATTAVYQNIRPQTRERVEFRDAAPTREAKPGLRVRDDTREQSVRPGTGPEGRDDARRPETRVLGPRGDRSGGKDAGDRTSPDAPSATPRRSLREDRQDGGKTPANGRDGASGGIRPVEPRSKGSRIWSGGRSASPPEQAVRPSVPDRSSEERRGGGSTHDTGGPPARKAPGEVKERGDAAPARDRSGGAETRPVQPPRSPSGRSAPSEGSSAPSAVRPTPPPSARTSSPPAGRSSPAPSARPSPPPNRGDRTAPADDGARSAAKRGVGEEHRVKAVRVGERS